MDKSDKIYHRLNRPRINDPTAPPVILSLTAYKKINLWTKLAAEKHGWEVSGLGTIVPRHGGLYVHDVWLLKPEKVGAAHVDMDPAAVHRLMVELAFRSPKRKHLQPYVDEYLRTGQVSDTDAFLQLADILTKGVNLRNFRFHWHSHGDLGVCWSGTDDDTSRRDFCSDAKWSVSLVTNARGNFLARQDFPREKKPPRDDLPVLLLLTIPTNISRKYRDEYNLKHRIHAPTPHSPTTADLLEILEPETKAV